MSNYQTHRHNFAEAASSQVTQSQLARNNGLAMFHRLSLESGRPFPLRIPNNPQMRTHIQHSPEKFGNLQRSTDLGLILMRTNEMFSESSNKINAFRA